MKIDINVKGVSNKASKIKKMTWDYPDKEYTLREFLCATVEASVKDYLGRAESRELLTVLSPGEIAEGAQKGKISFGKIFGEKLPDLEKSKKTAIRSFEDGLIAFFIGEERFEDLDLVLPLKDGCNITFVKLTFLAGRMW